MSEATTLNGADQDFDILQNYQCALEVASRVDEDAVDSIMQKLQLVSFESIAKLVTPVRGQSFEQS